MRLFYEHKYAIIIAQKPVQNDRMKMSRLTFTPSERTDFDNLRSYNKAVGSSPQAYSNKLFVNFTNELRMLDIFCANFRVVPNILV